MTESYGLFDYPDHPGAKVAGTSADAAVSMVPTASILRAQCLELVRKRGPLTADQCAEIIGRDRLAVRPRFSELNLAGQIKDTGIRRENSSGRKAVAWSAA
jgi:predicted ArsR family transcriptional regulator